MGNELLASKVVTQREAPALLAIEGVPTSSVGLVGVTQWGPIGEPTLITSFKEFKDIFGGFIEDHHLAVDLYLALKAPQGSKRVWVTRVTHFGDPDDATTTTAAKASTTLDYTAQSQGAVTSGNAGPWNLSDGETLVIHCDEDVGGPDTVTFNGTAARLVGGAWVGGLAAGEAVTLSCDGDPDDQVFTFAGGETVDQAAALINTTASGFRAIMVGGATLDFESDTEGTDSRIWLKAESVPGVAAKLGHVVAGAATAGGGNVGNIDSVTFAEAKSLIEAGVVNPVTGVTCTEETGGEITVTSNKAGGGAGSSVQIEVASTASDFAFDNLLHQGTNVSAPTVNVEGKYAGELIENWVCRVAAATNGEADRFNLLLVDDSGAIKEVFPNLIQGSGNVSDPDYVDTIVNDPTTGSRYIVATDDLGSDTRPVNGDYTLSGGDDGLTLLDDNDHLGLAGLGAYAWVPEFVALKAIPGRTSAAINQGLVIDAEAYGNFAILDPPSGQDATAVVVYAKTTAALYQLSEYAAIFWPWVKIPNPDASVYGSDVSEVTVPPSGAVLGATLQNDSRVGGVHEAPAGVENGRLWGVIGVEHRDALNPDKLDLVYPARVNPITRLAQGGSFFVDGSRTLLSTGPFPSIGESRGVIFIEQSIKRGTEWVRHRNIVQRLFRRIEAGIVAFLTGEMKKDAFATRDPETAFYVDVSSLLNPPSEQFAHKINIRIGLAKAKPAEWVILTITQDIRLLQEELGLE